MKHDRFGRPDIELPEVTLPQQAKRDIAAWRQQGKAAHVAVGEPLPQMACEDCVDLQQIFVRFCSAGPLRNPPGGRKPIMSTFDGNGVGWWVIEKTVPYECPLCIGEPVRMPQRFEAHVESERSGPQRIGDVLR